MEDKNLTPAEELKNNIDSAIEKSATKVTDTAATALEAKATEINLSVKEVKDENIQLQKQIDDMKNEQKNAFAIGKPKVSQFKEDSSF